MSPKTRQTVSLVLGLVFLIGVAYGFFVAAKAIIEVVRSLDSNIAVAIISAAALVLVSVLSIVLGNVYNTRTLIQKEHRDKKIPVYEDLIKFTFRMLMGTKTGTAPTEKETSEFMSDFTQRIMVWGSDDVLAAWAKLRRFSLDELAKTREPMEPVFLYEDLIKTIRRDLGHKNKGLERGDVLALFVNDIDKYIPKKPR